jgi:broad specificity phosphatase PhoE
MGILYFIRHGQASFGSEDYDRLSDIGIRQSQILGDFFNHTGLRFDAVYSGTLLRQRQTARTVMERIYAEEQPPELQVRAAFDEFDSAALLKAQVDDLVRENPDIARDLTQLESDPAAFQRVFDRALARMLAGAGNLSEDHTVTAFIRRVRSGIDTVAEELAGDGTAAVFTSGGTLSAVMHAALSLTENETVRLGWQIRNASVSCFRHGDGRLTLMAFNCTAHLEQQRDASLLTYL